MSSFLFVDSRVQDSDTLLSGLGEDVQVVGLDAGSDGIEQMRLALQGAGDLDAIHIVSHGASGMLSLGSAILTEDNLDDYQAQLAGIGAALASGGDILLYGCNVARGDTGKSFIERLAMWTGADVAASTTLTGSARLGGNWLLDASTGPVEAGVAFAAAALNGYAYTLPISTSNALVGGLGGTAGFGEGILAANDDGSTSAVNITSVFGAAGLDFFGTHYTQVYINNNGNVTFASATSAFTPGVISGGTSNPIIAPFWADVDTRGTGGVATPGGNSQGTNLMYYDLDTVNRVFTVTWDDVGYYSSHTDLRNAFQLQLMDRGSGNFDIVFRYEAINWTTGDASGGSGGLGGTVARMGFSAGNGTDYYELPVSGNQASVLVLESALGNTGFPGVYIFTVQSGQILPTLSIAAASADKAEGNSGATPFTFTVTRGGSTTGITTVNWAVEASGASPSADGADFGGAFPSGTLTFAATETTKTITVNVTGDTVYENAGLTENFVVTLSNASGGATFSTATAGGHIQNDDLQIVDDYAGNASTTGAMLAGGSSTGRIEVGGDQDWFAVALTAGQTYQFRLNAASVGGLNDPYLDLYNGSSSLLTYDDDEGGNLNSLITYTAPASGTYYLGARGYSSGTGSYLVSATALAIDDYAGNASTTGTVGVGGSTTGRVEVSGDQDWFRISLTAGQTYEFRLNAASSGGLTDPYLSLYNGSSSLLLSNDDGGGNLNSLITYTATASGTYYLGARAYSTGTGSYMVTATALTVDDFAGNASTTGTVGVGGSTTGRVEVSGDQDWFRISLTAGQTYEFRLNAASSGGLNDPYLSLYNGSSSLLTYNDDGGGNLNSMITYTATASGTYYLGARAYSTGTGSYSVSATSVTVDDFAGNASTTGTVSVGGSRTGRVEVSSDQDWFAVALTAGQTYEFRLNATSVGGLTDPYLSLYNGNSSLLASNDDGGGNLNSLITYTATASGTHYLGARAFSSGTGNYSVSATVLASPPPPSGVFDIVVNYTGDPAFASVFTTAAARWEQIITQDVPDVAASVSRFGPIDDLLINASVVAIDGAGNILGQAAPDAFRSGSQLPYHGFMQFDTADVQAMANDGILLAVIEHEMGHVLGIGTLWNGLSLKNGSGDFVGANALAQYRTLAGNAALTAVPVEQTGGRGTMGSHWSEGVFDAELMTGWSESTNPMPISVVTLGSLQDLGYSVNYSTADAYTLPSHSLATSDLVQDSAASVDLSAAAGPGDNAGNAPVAPLAFSAPPGGFTGSVYLHYDNKPIVVDAQELPIKLNGPITQLNENTIYFFDTTTGNNYLVVVEGTFEKNNPTLAENIKGSISGMAFYDNGEIIDDIDYPGLALDAQTVLLNWDRYLLTENNYLESRSSTPQNDLGIGLAGNDMLVLGAGNDTFNGGAGNDTMDGGTGADTAIYSSSRAGYTISGGGTSVSGPEGNDTLIGIERFQFSDKKIALDLGLNQAAGNTVRVIGAAFDGPAIQQHPDWVGIGLQFFDGGMSRASVCALVAQLMGQSNSAFVATLYTNVVGSAPDTGTRDAFVALLQGSGGAMTQGQLLELAATIDLNAVNINLVGLLQTGAEFA